MILAWGHGKLYYFMSYGTFYHYMIIQIIVVILTSLMIPRKILYSNILIQKMNDWTE